MGFVDLGVEGLEQLLQRIGEEVSQRSVVGFFISVEGLVEIDDYELIVV